MAHAEVNGAIKNAIILQIVYYVTKFDKNAKKKIVPPEINMYDIELMLVRFGKFFKIVFSL